MGRALVDQACFVAALSKVGTGLEEHAVVVADAAVEELVIDLFHNGIKSPRFPVEGNLCEVGSWRENARRFAYIVKDFLPNEGGIFEAVVEVQLLEKVVGLPRNESVQIHLEGLLVTWVAHARIAFQSDADRVELGHAVEAGDGDARGDVILLAVVFDHEFVPEAVIVEGQVDLKDLIGAEDVVAFGLGIADQGKA